MDGVGDRPQLGPLAGQLAAQLQLRLELDGLDHRLVGRPVPTGQSIGQERAALPAGDQRRGLAAQLQVLRLQLPELPAQVVVGLADDRDRRAAVPLRDILNELPVAVGDRLDHPDRFVPIAGPVLGPQDLRQAIGTGDLQVVGRLLDRIQAPLLGGEQRGEAVQPDLVDRPLDHLGAADNQDMGRDVVLINGPLHEPTRVGVGDVQRASPLLEDQQADLRLVDPLGRGQESNGDRQADQGGDPDQPPSPPEEADHLLDPPEEIEFPRIPGGEGRWYKWYKLCHE